MSKGARAMAVAMAHPDAKRGVHSELKNSTGKFGFDKALLSSARLVLRVTPHRRVIVDRRRKPLAVAYDEAKVIGSERAEFTRKLERLRRRLRTSRFARLTMDWTSTKRSRLVYIRPYIRRHSVRQRCEDTRAQYFAARGPNTMDPNKTAIERAFELARSGAFKRVAELVAHLDGEGYDGRQISGALSESSSAT